MEYRVYGDLTIVYPKPFFYLLKGDNRALGLGLRALNDAALLS